MSYNTLASAQALVGQAVNQELLNAARSIIDQHSDFRWGSTSEVLLFSGLRGERSIFVKNPIIAVASVEIDLEGGSGFETKTENTDYYVRKELGEIVFPNGLPVGHDNIQITYSYGFLTTDIHYPAVKMAEAQIALYLKRNPGMLSRVGIEGSSLQYDADPLARFLALIPQPIDPIAI